MVRRFLTPLLSLLALLVPATLLAAQAPTNDAGGPLFRPGQVTVYATPDQLPGVPLVKYLPNAKLSVIQVPIGMEEPVAAFLQDTGLVAGLNYEAHAFGTVNDPLTSYQWHFAAVQSSAAWDITTGSGIIVAVLDSGIATAGAVDGVNCITSGTDIVNGDNNPDDGDGHGTHVSGTIAQASNNGTGVAGLAYGACIMPVKVLDDTGSGDFADIADGVFYAVNNGASVINMSLGTNAKFGVTSIAAMDTALDYAYANDVTVVCASGNDSYRRNVSYPAIYPTTIGVGATDYRNQVTRYSNKGTGLDIVAPGGDSSRDDNGDGYGDGVLQETRIGGSWGYYFFDGTSMAAPHVAAAAALLYASGTATTPTAVYDALTCRALDLDAAGYDSNTGHGLLQVADALGYDGNCGGGGGGGGCTDNDNDGVCVEDGDCDDNNPDVYPGHNDTKGRWGRDGVDNDCNGVIDG